MLPDEEKDQLRNAVLDGPAREIESRLFSVVDRIADARARVAREWLAECHQCFRCDKSQCPEVAAEIAELERKP